MRFNLKINPLLKDTKITIEAPKETKQIKKLTSYLEKLSYTLIATLDDEQIKLPSHEIIYVETVDRKTFIYSEEEVYEANYSLVDLEKELRPFNVIRINKQTLVNAQEILSVKALIHSRYELKMTSGDKLIVSRHYRHTFQKLFTEGGLFHA